MDKCLTNKKYIGKEMSFLPSYGKLSETKERLSRLNLDLYETRQRLCDEAKQYRMIFQELQHIVIRTDTKRTDFKKLIDKYEADYRMKQGSVYKALEKVFGERNVIDYLKTNSIKALSKLVVASNIVESIIHEIIKNPNYTDTTKLEHIAKIEIPKLATKVFDES